MRRLWNTFLKGLVALLPVTLTVYLVWWLGSTAERILSGPLRALLPEDRYWPGLGLVVGFLLVLLVGVMVNAYVVRYLLRIGEAFLARIPIVKTIFGAFKDITQFLPAGGKARDLKRVVLWRFGAAQLIGPERIATGFSITCAHAASTASAPAERYTSELMVNVFIR